MMDSPKEVLYCLYNVGDASHVYGLHTRGGGAGGEPPRPEGHRGHRGQEDVPSEGGPGLPLPEDQLQLQTGLSQDQSVCRQEGNTHCHNLILYSVLVLWIVLLLQSCSLMSMLKNYGKQHNTRKLKSYKIIYSIINY